MITYISERALKPPDMDETAIATAARDDPAEFGRLYRLYAARVYRYIYSRLNHVQDSEDLTSLVFQSAWESLPRYREKGSFAAWLFSIARHKVNDFHRRSRPTRPLDEKAQYARRDWDPLARLELDEKLGRLAELLAGLEAEQAELLRLRFAADLTYQQIAEVSGRSPEAVKMAMHRMLARLHERWEPHDG
jgi:RNA polymerase sigma factor (sigma-70 family)